MCSVFSVLEVHILPNICSCCGFRFLAMLRRRPSGYYSRQSDALLSDAEPFPSFITKKSIEPVISAASDTILMSPKRPLRSLSPFQVSYTDIL